MVRHRQFSLQFSPSPQGYDLETQWLAYAFLYTRNAPANRWLALQTLAVLIRHLAGGVFGIGQLMHTALTIWCMSLFIATRGAVCTASGLDALFSLPTMMVNLLGLVYQNFGKYLT